MTGVRVVKVGGSLCDDPNLADTLQTWLNRQPKTLHVLIAGGGARVDWLREIAATFELDDETAHWLAISMMSLTSIELAARLDVPRIEVFEAVRVEATQNEVRRQAIVFDCERFLACDEPHRPGLRLPASWDVTSDSISARVAVALGAAELVLLKTVPAPQRDVANLAKLGFVDTFLPAMVAELRALRIESPILDTQR